MRVHRYSSGCLCIRQLTFLLFSFMVSASAQSDVTNSVTADLSDLSLSELSRTTITSVSKKPENVADTASAAFVITQEDIRRSGALSVPEALRMVPGVHVARANDGDWYVAVRGFNGELSNKLLVLIDGRSIYSPVFSGVFWYDQDVLMEDVERIEVIRGPGATMWGANAVNGVINIITKNAKDRQGASVSVTGGTFERFSASARYGLEIGDDGFGAVWAKFYDRDELDDDHNTDPLVPDNWDSVAAGFRYDWDPPTPDTFSLQGSWRQVQADDSFSAQSLESPFRSLVEYDRVDTLFNFMGRYSRRFSESSEASFQAYYDSVHNDYGNSDLRYETIDIESQYRFALGRRNDVIVGAGYRWITDDYDPHDEYAITFFTPAKSERDTPSFFVQDEIDILSDSLSLILGMKVEENDYTGWEFQPNARLKVQPCDSHFLWGAVSRAVRTPSRIEDDATGAVVVPPAALPYPYSTYGIPLEYVILPSDLESEELLAYELGHRFTPNRGFWIDTTVFVNEYENLRVYEMLSGITEASDPDHFETLIATSNGKEGYTYGAEVSSTWRVSDSWSLKAAYSYMDTDLDLKDGHTDFAGLTVVEGTLPKNQFSLRSQWDVTANVECDAWLRYVDELEALGVDEYVTVDLRLAWRPSSVLELAIVGQNLGEEWHQEFTSYEVERSVYAKATLTL